MGNSSHLDEIITRHRSIATIQVVFADVVDYSKRRTQTQVSVVEAFSTCLAAALEEVARTYVNYAQSNGVNFATDIIRIPTGDGAALGFTFDGLNDIHLTTALALLRQVKTHNDATPCEKFDQHGWCNCHSNFKVRVGVSEGRGVIYTDLNDHYNCAGSVINLASRVMGIVGPQQVAFTESAYTQIVDLVDDVTLADRFRELRGIRIKHGERINLYQYCDPQEEALSSDMPAEIEVLQKVSDLMRDMSAMAPLMPGMGGEEPKTDPASMLTAIDQMRQRMSQMQEIEKLKRDMNAEPGSQPGSKGAMSPEVDEGD